MTPTRFTPSRLLATVTFSVGLLTSSLGLAEDTTEVAPSIEPMHFASEGKVKIAGKVIEFQAVAGQLLMRNDEGEPIALYGYTSYTR